MRAEAFSDGVFAIAVTLLVLGLANPPHSPGGPAHALLVQWPSYLGYLASFSYVAVIWLNHHQAFVRIHSMDRGLHVANLLLLFTTAALAFPTSVVSDAVEKDASGDDARVSVVLYSLVAAAMCLSWLILYAHLRRHPELIRKGVEPSYVRYGLLRSAAGAVAYLVAGALGVLITQVIAMVSSSPCRSSTSSPRKGCRARLPRGRGGSVLAAAARRPPLLNYSPARLFPGSEEPQASNSNSGKWSRIPGPRGRKRPLDVVVFPRLLTPE